MSTELVQNLNSLHSGQENFLKAESSEKLKRAIKRNKRTHADIVNKQGDIVFYISKKYSMETTRYSYWYRSALDKSTFQ